MILFTLTALSIILLPGCAAELVDNGDIVDADAQLDHRTDELNLEDNSNADDRTPSNKSNGKSKQPKVKLLGLEDVLNLERSGLVGLGNDFNYDTNDGDNIPPRLNYNQLHADDMVEDSFYDPFSPDPSCVGTDDDCWHPPDSTIEEEEVVEGCDGDGTGTKSAGLETLPWGYGGADPDDDIDEEEDEQEKEQQEECVDSIGEVDGENEEGGEDPKPQCQKPTSTTEESAEKNATCKASKTKFVDKHWGSDINILQMRDRLRGRRGKYWDTIQQDQGGNVTEAGKTEDQTISISQAEKGKEKQEEVKRKQHQNKSPPRPPVFLLPGLASTRLISWKHKPCPQSSLLSDIKMLDNVWLNMNLLVQMATIDARCWNECMTLGKYESDYDGADDEMENETHDKKGSKDDKKEEQPFHGCKLRPDEGLDSISSLAPGSISSNLFVGGTNTVYAWLIQWLADNLGYDVTSIVALPYDWRLSPVKMEDRDGFLTLTRKKIEAAVESNGRPGIMVAHSMGNSVFRYFLDWLRVQMREQAYERYVQQAKHTAADRAAARAGGRGPFWRGRALYRGFIHQGEALNMIEGEEGEHNTTEDGLDDLAWALGPQKGEPSTAQRKVEEGEETGSRKYPKLYEIAKVEGDTEWIDWLGKHIWTYVGLAAPLLGAPGPLRSVLSGENMGLPFTDEEARGLELSFGSTATVNPISTKMGFCDGDGVNRNLACLEEIVSEIESESKGKTNPWKDFPALRLLLKDRVDFDSLFPTVRVEREYCEENEDSPCNNQTSVDFGPKEIMNGGIFKDFSTIWREKGDPLGVKLDQLRQAWWRHDVPPNMLESTPDRPHIKHVIMAYGTDVPTEVGYVYRKTDLTDNSNTANSTDPGTTTAEEFDGVPSMTEIIWEDPHGSLFSESKLVEPSSFTDILRKKKPKRSPLKTHNDEAPKWLHHSGDGTIPYIAMRISNITTSMLDGERISNPHHALDSIKVSHRPKGGNGWVEGYGANPQNEEDYERPNIGDTGTSHPHGTKYKPKMVRFESSGKSRSTGMEYTTTVIEAIGVEHKETTRNYDILAAAFTDVLKNLHDDYGLI
ncbi:hypothetical protein ACHAXR_010432 [Thalassiosira sp. AJA248-18]